MKEVTYGWYPSANDIYRSKGRPTTSHLECLYRQDSMYYQGKMGAPPPELMIMGVSTNGTITSQDQKRHHRSKTVSVPKFKPVPKLHIPTPTECWNKVTTQRGVAETTWGVIGDSSSAPINKDVNWPLPAKKQPHQQQQSMWRQHLTPQQQQQLLKEHLRQQKMKSFTERQASPQYAWGFRKPPQENPRPLSPSSAEIKWPTAKQIPPSRPQTSSSSQINPGSARPQKPRPASSPAQSAKQRQETLQQQQYTPAPPAGENALEGKRPSRIQSATVRRDKTPLPTRPQTASPRKQDISPRLPVSSRDRISSSRVTRPAAPVPFIYDVNDNSCDPVDDGETEVQKDESLDEDEYEENLKKYGWRAQVHGDPYKLKRPLPRMSYAVACPEPEVPPEPPGVHMECNETFFYNTIPNKPMTVDVDKEWISEVIMAKRLELQKREGGIKYSYKNFSFVY